MLDIFVGLQFLSEGSMQQDRKAQEDALRDRIGRMLAGGLQTQVEPIPQSDSEFGKMLCELHDIEPDDLKSKLVLSGFTDKPYGPDRMCCRECIYYQADHKWCDIPERALPVEPDWWCRLWRT